MAVVLVTGGAGYIGAHACRALADRGHTPVTFDNLSTGWREAVRFGPFFEGDLLDRDALSTAFQATRPQAVMHFAAKSLVGESSEHPEMYWRNNVVGSLNLIEAARDSGAAAFVFSSTCAIYGDQQLETLTEDSPQQPNSPYGETKRAVEAMLRDQAAAGGPRTTFFRYFNVAGAEPEAGLGERHEPETHLIPLVLQAAAGRRAEIAVFGEDYPTPDGTCVRDYIHVTDLVAAHVAGLERLLDGGAGGAFNLGSGRGYSVREVIDRARAVTGRAIPERSAPRRAGDPARLVSGASRAEAELGWRPARSLDQMIGDAWSYFEAVNWFEDAPKRPDSTAARRGAA